MGYKICGQSLACLKLTFTIDSTLCKSVHTLTHTLVTHKLTHIHMHTYHPHMYLTWGSLNQAAPIRKGIYCKTGDLTSYKILCVYGTVPTNSHPQCLGAYATLSPTPWVPMLPSLLPHGCLCYPPWVPMLPSMGAYATPPPPPLPPRPRPVY